MKKKRVFSGIQPTGSIHIGNYLGAIKNWVDSQDDFDNIFCVVDLHAITIKQDPEVLKTKIREVAGLYLASGLDSEKNTIFIQSDISAHSELAWILDCFLPLGWMNKMTQFKEKSEMQKENATVGLFNYPALMSADILLYDTEVVPVGSDQKQHVELARDVAKRFNSIYEKNIFIVPEAKIRKETARIMDLQDPLKKMSKSEGKSIGILDSLDEIQSKIMTAHTDSFNEVAFDDERPGIHNLLTIYEAFSGESRGDIETKFEGKGYADFKKDLAELVIEKLIPIQDKYKEISESGEIDEVLKKGAEKARPLAEKKIQEVKKVIGLG